jgi:hypothetical protein
LQQGDAEGRDRLGAGWSLNQVSSYIREEMADGLPALLRHAFGDDQPMALLRVALETKQADRLRSCLTNGKIGCRRLAISRKRVMPGLVPGIRGRDKNDWWKSA